MTIGHPITSMNVNTAMMITQIANVSTIRGVTLNQLVKGIEMGSFDTTSHPLFPGDQELEYICPWCDYRMDEDEAEDTGDCGCPSCRKIIEWI